jgi:hypothetical protein
VRERPSDVDAGDLAGEERPRHRVVRWSPKAGQVAKRASCP